MVMTRVFALGKIQAGKTPRLATPTEPQSKIVVTPECTPMASASQLPMPTPSVIAPLATCACASIRPGTTCRPAPRISRTRAESPAAMSAAIRAIFPPAIAMSSGPSSPCPGSSTWPPLISRSYVGPAISLTPQLLAGQLAAQRHRPQLGPHDFLVADPRPDAAVGAGLDVLPADHAGVVDQPLGDQAGRLDEVGGVRDAPGDQDLAVGQLDVAPHGPLVGVPDVPGLDRVGLGVDLQHQVGDVDEVDVGNVRPVPAPPAHVEPDLVRGDALQRVVDDRHAELQVLAVPGHVP